MDVEGTGHRAAGDRVDPRARVGHVAQLGHPRPEPARRTELRDRRELLVGGRQPELEQTEGLLRRDTRGLEGAQHRRAPGEHPAELLAVGSALFVNRGPVDDRGPHTRLKREPCERLERGVVGGAQVAVRVERAERDQRPGLVEGR